MSYWEDRLTQSEHAAVDRALTKFRKGRKDTNAQHILYDDLVNNRVTEEEADEIINIET